MRLFLQFAFWGACAVVAVLSLLPTAYLPSVAFDWWDKAQHALAFLLLGSLGLLSYPSFARRVFVGLAFSGVAIELAQEATGWRYGDWQDWGADVFGLGMAMIAAGIQRYLAGRLP